ncbi:hypothetical protein DPEC_G00373720 [Dallia pectoralis]|nr:hypothetical protein DPEC_G00373720 [Dallia pectoralis]
MFNWSVTILSRNPDRRARSAARSGDLAGHPLLFTLWFDLPLQAESHGPHTHPENQHARIPTASVWSTLPDTRRGHQGEVSGNKESRCWWKEVPQTLPAQNCLGQESPCGGHLQPALPSHPTANFLCKKEFMT